MLKYAVLAVAAVTVATPVLAADFYIVRGPDKKCRIVETRPTDKTLVVIGDKAYVSRDEAEKQLKVVCKDM